MLAVPWPLAGDRGRLEVYKHNARCSKDQQTAPLGGVVPEVASDPHPVANAAVPTGFAGLTPPRKGSLAT
jgi:hypothetical protein